MLNKTFLQLFLLVIVIIIPIFFFKSYFIKEKKSDISKNIENIDEQKILDKKKSNLIYNIEYVSEFKNGNYYIISSEYGE